MAIQIWDAQAGQYKSADIARFGGSGTLKEALVWDGTQYVKVWPNTPPSIYPVSGSWGPTNVPTAATTFDSHVIEEAGEYTITHTATSSGSPIAFIAGIRTPHRVASGPDGSPSTITITEQFQPGDLIEFRALSLSASISSGTWSITKH